MKIRFLNSDYEPKYHKGDILIIEGEKVYNEKGEELQLDIEILKKLIEEGRDFEVIKDSIVEDEIQHKDNEKNIIKEENKMTEVKTNTETVNQPKSEIYIIVKKPFKYYYSSDSAMNKLITLKPGKYCIAKVLSEINIANNIEIRNAEEICQKKK